MPIFGNPWGVPYLPPQTAIPTWTYYSTTTTPLPAPEVDEERVRRIVREEIADIVAIDVPDHPPES
jgi:hypothetical protein